MESQMSKVNEYIKVCPVCGKEFSTPNRRKKYCFINEDGTDNYDAIREANKLTNLFPLFIEDHKKLTNLYNSESRWLNKEEIKEFIIGKDND